MKEPFVMLPRSLLESTAWRKLGINERRFLDFLMSEHMRRGGKKNGFLIAPRRQLWAFGIGARHVSPAINSLDATGLVDIKRGVGRRPSTYALTWLPLADGTEPSNRWRDGNECRRELATNEFPRDTLEVSEGNSQSPVASAEGNSQSPKSRVSEGNSPSRRASSGLGRGGRAGRTPSETGWENSQ